MKIPDKIQARIAAELINLNDLTLDQIKLSLIYSVGELAKSFVGGNAKYLQIGWTSLALHLALLEKRFNFEAPELNKPSRVYEGAQVIFFISKAVSRVAEGDIYSGCADIKYWLAYYLVNFAEEAEDEL